MVVRAVAFDIGGVLYRKDPDNQIGGRWAQRLGISEADFDTALSGRLDPDKVIATGGINEAEIKRRYAAALGLSDSQRDEFMADMWAWYCGHADDEMVLYSSSLRPQFRTGLLSNSADGARREEQARYGFEELFDVILYSHEVGLAKPDPEVYSVLCDRLLVAPNELVFLDDGPANVQAARKLGIQAILHQETRQSIQEISALLGS
jgi:epoxide hydrolase-like predicted phosphatase